jgi:hypothetical protein
MVYDRAGRLTERRIVLPVVASPVLAANTYDVAAAGCYNNGRLTKASNDTVSQQFCYSGGGTLLRQDTVESVRTHSVVNVLHANQAVLYKTYMPGPLSTGANAARWQYDGVVANFWRVLDL